MIAHFHHEHFAVHVENAQAKASEEPHWPAPGPPARCSIPSILLKYACGTAEFGLWLPGGLTLSSL